MTIGIAIATLLAACSGDLEQELVTGSIGPSDQRPSDEALAMGKRHFTAGHYGLAERQFRAAVEQNPKSGPSWLGLAAAYDRLGRYKLASRAYREAEALQGRPPELLNNLGYHELLQGRLKSAQRYFLEAQSKDPGNPYIENNLALVQRWINGERPPELQQDIVAGRHPNNRHYRR